MPTLFAVIAIVFGVLYAFVLPPLQAPDEAAHLCRAYGLSKGHFVAPAPSPLPVSLYTLFERYPPHLERVRKVTRAELVAAINEPLKPDIVTEIPNQGMNVNTWIPYIPSAIAILVARPMNISSLGLLYVSRLANLVGYVALTWFALHLLQGGRMILYALGLMPMTLHQAASLSWDSIVFAMAFVFCALIIHYTIDGSRLQIRQGVALLGAVVIVSLCKVDFALLPLLLLLPVGCYGSRKRQIAFLAVWGTAALLTNAIWSYVNRVNLELFKRWVDSVYQTKFPGNIWYIYHHPVYFMNALGRTVFHDFLMHFTEFVGTFGWLFVRLPPWIVIVYGLMLLTTGLVGASALRLSWFQRVILLGVVLVGSFGCVLPMWLTTPPTYIENIILHNIGALSGIQGRHFIPFGLPALLLLANKYVRVPSVVLVACVTACIITANTIGVMAIRSAY